MVFRAWQGIPGAWQPVLWSLTGETIRGFVLFFIKPGIPPRKTRQKKLKNGTPASSSE